MIPAVFLDRDGVLNVYLPGDYVKTPGELVLLPGVGEAIARLNHAGYAVFIISNQQGVSKGLMTEEDLQAVDASLRQEITQKGGKITESFYCPHRAGECECRKPKPGMIRKAVEKYDIDLTPSVFVGDTDSDAAAARAGGVGRFFLVLTGKYPDASVAADTTLFPTPPDAIFPDLLAAVQSLLSEKD